MNESQNTYCNGSTWQLTRTSLACKGTNTWLYTISAVIFTAGDKYSISAMAYDTTGGHWNTLVFSDIHTGDTLDIVWNASGDLAWAGVQLKNVGDPSYDASLAVSVRFLYSQNLS